MCEVEKGIRRVTSGFISVDSSISISYPNTMQILKAWVLSILFIALHVTSPLVVDHVGFCFTQQIWRSGNTGLKVIRKKVSSIVSSLFRDYLQTEVSLHFDLCWHYGYMMQHTKRHKWEMLLTTSEVFGVPSLCNEFSCGLVGQVNSGKRQRPSLFQNLSSDEHILSNLASIHVPATHTHIVIL